jgi:oligopeptidase B
MDDYAWFRPQDWRAVLKAPDTLSDTIEAVIQLENDYTDAMLAPSAPLQQQLVERMQALDAQGGAPVQVRDGDHLYYQRSGGDASAPVYVRRPAAGGAEQVLLDVGAEAQGRPRYKLSEGGPQHSQDGRLLGWAADPAGTGMLALRVRDIASGTLLVDDIDDAFAGFALAPDGRYLYWVGRTDQGVPSKVFRREIGGRGKSGGATLVYENPDPGLYMTLRTTAAGGYVVIHLSSGDMTEVRLVPMADPTATPVLVEPRTKGLHYDVEEWNGQLLLLTDADGAADFKLMTTDARTPGRAHWQPFVAHQLGRFILAIHPFAHYLVREEWRDALPRLVVMTRDGKERDIAFDEAAYALTVPRDQGWHAPTLGLTYASPRTPRAPCQLTLASGEYVRATGAIDSKVYDRERFEVRRVVAPAADGALVPITLLMRKGQKLDGSAPLYLYGYGSYGLSANADFSSSALAQVEQGWIYAIAHVRGGAERGTGWWRSVLRHGKKTTFTDFITCAEFLIGAGYTRKRRIVAHGFSAGGLLMGAVYTMRPDLWAGVIARAPFVDLLTTMEHYDIHPLGSTAFPYWGDPRVPADHAYMASYSPYEQLGKAAYPALLAVGSVADNAVAFWEPLKFAVKARTLTTAGNPILSRTGMYAGHMGVLRTKAHYVEQASFIAFGVWAAARKWGDVPQRPAPIK